MSALRQVKKVNGGYEVTVKCTGTPMQTRVFGSYQECEVFADDYFFDYLGVQLKCAHHPVGDGVEPEGVNPDSLETVEIEIPMNERLKELAEQAGLWNNEYDLVKVIERFAELVRQDEQASCAKLLDDFAKTEMMPAKDTWRMGVMAAANAVRDKK